MPVAAKQEAGCRNYLGADDLAILHGDPDLYAPADVRILAYCWLQGQVSLHNQEISSTLRLLSRHEPERENRDKKHKRSTLFMTDLMLGKNRFGLNTRLFSFSAYLLAGSRRTFHDLAVNCDCIPLD